MDSRDMALHSIRMKTFGIRTPSGLLLKLRHDITRLKGARASLEMGYAALDCAITAWHLMDWLLASVSPKRHEELTGIKQGKSSPAKGFIERNEHRLPGIRDCQLIANTGKHLVLSGHDDPSLETQTAALFEPPFDANDPSSWPRVTVRPVAYILRGKEKVDAVAFFVDMERQWRHLLVEEGFLSASLRDQEID